MQRSQPRSNCCFRGRCNESASSRPKARDDGGDGPATDFDPRPRKKGEGGPSGRPLRGRHAKTPTSSAGETPCDWAQIAALYAELARLTASPVVELNRAIAVAETDGPEAGLRIVDRLGLDDFRYLHSTRAELLRRLGRIDEARDAYRRARDLTDDGAERRFIERRLGELASAAGSGFG